MIIGINAGHTISGAGFGAIGYITESVETRVLASMVIEHLKSLGHSVVNCTCDKASSQNAYLDNVVDIANAYKLDIFLSIHFNSLNASSNGVEAYTYGGRGTAEAVKMVDKISHIGFKNRGIKNGSYLKVVRDTKAKAILLEVCFVSNKSDSDLYKQNKEKIAAAIVEALTGERVENVKEDVKISDLDKARQELMKLGVTDGSRPKDVATRQEVFAMLYRLYEKLK